jgi:hypothetical protein
MDKNLKEQDALLIKEKGKKEIFAASMDKNGKVNGVNPNIEHPDFVRIDKNGNVLENFFENFMRQTKNPTHFEFFKAPVEKLKESIEKLQEAFKNPEIPSNKTTLDMHRLDPEAFAKKKYAIDPNRVDWEKLEQQWGVKRETLEKTGNLEKLLNYQKTNLLPLTAKFDDTTLRTDARLSLREQPDGRLSFAINAIRKEPELERPYFGVKFSEEDKHNLLTTGNLCRVADAEFKQGEKTPVFISIDKQTNELIAFHIDKIKIPETIKGVQLDERQKQALSEGKPVFVEGMTSKNGKEFSANIQVNAEKRSIEFRFDNDKKQSQQQGNEMNEVQKTFRKKELTEDQRNSLREGKSVYVNGLFDTSEKEYCGYMTLNREKGKIDFMFPGQYRAALEKGSVIPDNHPKSEKQEAKEKKEVKKSKGIKI